MQLYFVRHGESENVVQKAITNPGIPYSLTVRGAEQVSILADHMTTVSVKHIYSSPLKRTAQTAEILATQFGLEYIITDALLEFDPGILAGKSDAASWKILFDIWDDWILRRNWTRQFEQGDSFESIKARFLPFLDSLVEQFYQVPDAIVLVGHDGAFRAMLPLLLANINFEFAHKNWIPVAGYVRAEFRKGSLFCTHWGDVTFS